MMMTTDLDQFKFTENQRSVNEKHVDHLQASVEQKNVLHAIPIIVNSDMEVLDGQHRLMVAKRLSLPIYYIIDDDFDSQTTALINNSIKTWSLMDYLRLYVRQENDHYIQLQKLLDETGFSLSNLLCWCSRSIEKVTLRRELKTGQFSISWFTDEDIDILIKGKTIIDFLNGCTGQARSVCNRQSFHQALSHWLRHHLVDYERLVHAMQKYSHMMKPCTTTMGYLQTLSDIYNFKRSNRLEIIIANNKKWKIIPVNTLEDNET